MTDSHPQPGELDQEALPPPSVALPAEIVPLQTIPTTLAPFVLTPSVVELLPQFNVEPPAPPTLNSPLFGVPAVIAPVDDRIAVERDIEHIMSATDPSLPTTLLDQALPSQPLHQLVLIPIETTHALFLQPETYLIVWMIYEALTDANATEPLISTEPEFQQLVSQVLAATTLPADHQPPAPAPEAHSTQQDAMLPPTTQEPVQQTQEMASTLVALLNQPLVPIPDAAPLLISASEPLAPSAVASDQMPDIQPTVAARPFPRFRLVIGPPPPETPTTASSSNRKRSRSKVLNYAVLSNGGMDYEDDESAYVNILDDPEYLHDVSERPIKKAKRTQAVKQSEPAEAVTTTPVSAPGVPHLESSEPMQGPNASRRFGYRLHELFLWYDLATAPIPPATVPNEIEEAPALPPAICLSDLYTDLHNADVAVGFFKSQHIPKFIDCLRRVNRVSSKSPFSFLELQKSATHSSSMISSTQCGLTAAVIVLFILSRPSFDKKHLSDECLDDACVFVQGVISGLTHNTAEHRPGKHHDDDGIEDEDDTDKEISPKKVTNRSRKKKAKHSHEDLVAWEVGPLVPLVKQLTSLIYEALDFVSLLAATPNLSDEHIQQFMKLARSCLFTYGLSTLQNPSIRTLHQVYLFYPTYRQSMIQDIFDAVVDFSQGSKTAVDLRYGQSSLMTSLIILLLQSNPDTLTASSQASDMGDQAFMAEDKPGDAAVATKQRPLALSRLFARNLFDAAIARIEDKEDPYVTLLEKMVNELINHCLFRPEWPAAEMLLKEILQNLLHMAAGTHPAQENSKVTERQRMVSATLLGLIGTRLVSLRLYASTANVIKRPAEGNAETSLAQELAKCPLCTLSHAGKKMLSCTRCYRWFHLECYGIAPCDATHSWYCDACLLGFVTDMLQDAENPAPFPAPTISLDSNKMDIDLMSSDTATEAVSTNGDSNDKNSHASDSSPVSTELTLAAMRMLVLNYLNDRPELDAMDAKRHLLKAWLLETENGSELMQQFLRSQYAPSKLPVHWPPGKLNPSHAQVASNAYYRHLQEFLERGARGSAVGMIPSRLGCQIFLSRSSAKSSMNPSIFVFFSKILDQLVVMLSSEHAKLRALALRAITNLVDADMNLLRDPHVYQAVEARLVDPSSMTREKALNMLGRFIMMKPDVVPQYASLIQDRIDDSSISVRRRAVRIIQSICLLVPNSKHVVNFCAALAKRIGVPGEQIKESVLALFRQIWFAQHENKTELLNAAKAEMMDPDLPQAELSVSMMDNEIFTSRDLTDYERVDQILQVLKETVKTDPEREALWFTDLLQSMKTGKYPLLDDLVKQLADFLSNIGEEAELEAERQQRCDDLVKHYEGSEAKKQAAMAMANQNREEVLRKKVLYSVALNYIASVMPEIVGEHFSQLRLLVKETASATHVLEKKLTEIVLGVLESIIPHVRHPSDEVWIAMLKDISLLLQNHGMPTIAAAIKCAAAIARRSDRINWIKSLYALLVKYLKSEVSSKTPSAQNVIRSLFTLGMILKCFPLDAPTSFKPKDFATVSSIRACRYGPHVEEVYSFIVHFWRSQDRDIKTAAVLTLGHLAPGSPGIFVRDVSADIISSALDTSSLEQLKAQALKTINEFLTEEAARMAADKSSASQSKHLSQSKRIASQQDSPDAMDADNVENGELDNMFKDEEVSTRRNKARNDSERGNDTGLSSTIVELYIKRILALALDKSIAIRTAALALVEQVLKMGLTHPSHCVPTLVALETDEHLGEVAHRTLCTQDIGRIQNRIAEGIKTSYFFQNTVFRVPSAIRLVSEGNMVTYHSNLSRCYSIFANAGKVARNNFLAAAFGQFETQAASKKESFEPLYLSYLTLLIAQLPFTSQEEALYAVYRSNTIISNIGFSVLDRLKAFYSGDDKQKSCTCPPEDDIRDAVVSWHLLMLKQFLRHFYSLDADRCRNYLPSDTSSSPIANHVTSVNIQDYLHKLDPSFDGLQVPTDIQKRPDSCEALYNRLKASFKAQDNDHTTVTETKSKRKRQSTASTDGTPHATPSRSKKASQHHTVSPVPPIAASPATTSPQESPQISPRQKPATRTRRTKIFSSDDVDDESRMDDDEDYLG